MEIIDEKPSTTRKNGDPSLTIGYAFIYLDYNDRSILLVTC